MADQLTISGILWTDQRNFYPDPGMVARLHPAATPFLSDLFMMTPRRTPDVDFKMFQKEPTWRDQYFDINNGSGEAWGSDGAPGDTNTATVDGATGIVIDDSLAGCTVEIWSSDLQTYRGAARVQSVTDSTTVVLESLGNPASATFLVANMSDNDRLFVNGYAGGEIHTAPDAYSGAPTVVFNSLQHLRTSLELSYDLINSALRGVEGARSKLQEEQTDKADEHKLRGERTLWTGMRNGGVGGVAWGAVAAGTTTDSFAAAGLANTTEGRIRTMMGYIPAVLRYGKRSDTEDDQSYFARTKAAYTFEQFDTDMDKVFQFEDDPSKPGQRDAYCGPGAFSFWTHFVLNNLGSTINISNAEIDATTGYRFRMLETPHGGLRLIKCADWRGRYTNHMAIPAKRFIKLRIMQGAGPGNAQDPGLMGYFPDIKKDNRPLLRKDEYHSHFGLDITQIKSQALMVFS